MKSHILILSFFLGHLAYGHGDKSHKKNEKNIQMEAINQNSQRINEINQRYLEEVKPIFKRACFDCHSSQTHYPWYYNVLIVKQIIDRDIKEAKEHLDFTSDFPFKSHGESPKEDLKSILEEVLEGEMPPFKYTLLHPEAKMTKKEVQTIRDWVESSLEKFNEKGNH